MPLYTVALHISSLLSYNLHLRWIRIEMKTHSYFCKQNLPLQWLATRAVLVPCRAFLSIPLGFWATLGKLCIVACNAVTKSGITMMARSVINKLFALLGQICVCNPAFALNPEEFDWGRWAVDLQGKINRHAAKKALEWRRGIDIKNP